jgi:hypothetical protein
MNDQHFISERVIKKSIEVMFPLDEVYDYFDKAWDVVFNWLIDSF